MRRPFEKWIWMFPVALCVHNIEEAIWLPDWSQRAGFWMHPVGVQEFRIAAALLAILGIVVTVWAARSGKQSVGVYVLAGFAFAMLLNVGFHIMATLVLGVYAPGVVTAVLINLLAMSFFAASRFSARLDPLAESTHRFDRSSVRTASFDSCLTLDWTNGVTPSNLGATGN